MMQEEDDPFTHPAQRLAATYEIGQALEDLSLEEIAERIDLLHAEIARLEQAHKSKLASREMAAAFFKI